MKNNFLIKRELKQNYFFKSEKFIIFLSITLKLLKFASEKYFMLFG